MAVFKFPKGISFDEAIDVGKRIIKRGGSIPGIALTGEFDIGNPSPFKGDFHTKVRALRRFSILKPEKENGEYVVTDLMKKAANESNQKEAFMAKKEMWENIPLIKKLYKEFEGSKPGKGEFIAGLCEIAETDWSEAEEKSDMIYKLYMDSLDYLEPSEVPEEGVPAEGPGETEIKVPEPSESEVEIGEHRVGDAYIRVPMTKESIEKVRKVLDLWEEELE